MKKNGGRGKWSKGGGRSGGGEQKRKKEMQKRMLQAGALVALGALQGANGEETPPILVGPQEQEREGRMGEKGNRSRQKLNSPNT